MACDPTGSESEMPLRHARGILTRPACRLLLGACLLLAAIGAGSAAVADPAPAPAAPAPDLPNVLVINSYGAGYAWSDDELRGLLGVLQARIPNLEPVIQHLDKKRFPDPARDAWLLQDLVDKCRQFPPRLIVTLDNSAFDFALRHRAVLGADVPIVFGGLNRFTPEMIAGQRHITGVSEETDFSGTFTLLRCLAPGARRILVISNRSESAVEKRRAFAALAPKLAADYELEYYEDWTSRQLIERVAALPDGTVGLILDVTVDAEGHNNYNDAGFTAQLASLSRMPLFITARPPGPADWTQLPWDGVGGGLVVADVHGAKVGELAAQVLAGRPADSIPVERYSPQSLEVDYRHLRRFGLTRVPLPPGTIVLNEPTSFYRVNRSRIILAAAVFTVLCGVIVALSINILRRRRAERALRLAEEQLRSAQKMEAIGLLAGGVAHDFNNILQVIEGHTAFLLESGNIGPQDREDVEMIRTGAQRAAQLTRQLLVFSRKQTLSPAPLDPNALVQDLTKMLRRVLGEHIELTVVPLPAPTTLVADCGQLEQVLLNLCLNARDAMPAGGRITIALDRVLLGASDCAKHPGLKPGPHLSLKVADTGSGMPPAVIDHLFEPFFTTKPAGKGTGLGLSVVYGIVRQHGGAITVESEVGHGSTFHVLLPFIVAAPGARTAPPDESFPRGHGTILLAEDDLAVQRLAVRTLEQNGFTVLAANDGAQAEALLAAHRGQLRLAILDVLMPLRSGRQVHDTIRADHPGLPVLYSSGYTAEMLPPGTAPEPGVALLHKPYSARELLATIHRLLGD